jgi:hypothetical protein
MILSMRQPAAAAAAAAAVASSQRRPPATNTFGARRFGWMPMLHNSCRYRCCHRKQFVSALGWLFLLFLYGIAMTHLDAWEDRSFDAVLRMNREGERIANETAQLQLQQQQETEVDGMDNHNNDDYDHHGDETQQHTISLWKLVLIYMMVRLYAQQQQQQQRSREDLPQTQPSSSFSSSFLDTQPPPQQVPLLWQQQQLQQMPYHPARRTTTTVLQPPQPPPAAEAAAPAAPATLSTRRRNDVNTDLHTGFSREEIERFLPVQTVAAAAATVTEESSMNHAAVEQQLSYCAICLEPWENNTNNHDGNDPSSSFQVRRILPQCGHGFHPHCIDPWLQRQSTCPVCQQTVIIR